MASPAAVNNLSTPHPSRFLGLRQPSCPGGCTACGAPCGAQQRASGGGCPERLPRRLPAHLARALEPHLLRLVQRHTMPPWKREQYDRLMERVLAAFKRTYSTLRPADKLEMVIDGSVMKGTALQDSDVDLLFKSWADVPRRLKNQLLGDLEVTLRRHRKSAALRVTAAAVGGSGCRPFPLEADLLFELATVGPPVSPVADSLAGSQQAKEAVKALKLFMQESFGVAKLKSFCMEALMRHVVCDCWGPAAAAEATGSAEDDDPAQQSAVQILYMDTKTESDDDDGGDSDHSPSSSSSSAGEEEEAPDASEAERTNPLRGMVLPARYRAEHDALSAWAAQDPHAGGGICYGEAAGGGGAGGDRTGTGDGGAGGTSATGGTGGGGRSQGSGGNTGASGSSGGNTGASGSSGGNTGVSASSGGNTGASGISAQDVADCASEAGASRNGLQRSGDGEGEGHLPSAADAPEATVQSPRSPRLESRADTAAASPTGAADTAQQGTGAPGCSLLQPALCSSPPLPVSMWATSPLSALLTPDLQHMQDGLLAHSAQIAAAFRCSSVLSHHLSQGAAVIGRESRNGGASGSAAAANGDGSTRSANNCVGGSSAPGPLGVESGGSEPSSLSGMQRSNNSSGAARHAAPRAAAGVNGNGLVRPSAIAAAPSHHREFADHLEAWQRRMEGSVRRRRELLSVGSRC